MAWKITEVADEPSGGGGCGKAIAVIGAIIFLLIMLANS